MLPRSPAPPVPTGVCDSPKYFYEYIDGLLSGLGATPEAVGASAAELVRMVRRP